MCTSYMVGMISKISEEMAKIPVSNKQAYRTLFMQVPSVWTLSTTFTSFTD